MAQLEGEYTQACLLIVKRPDLLLVAKHHSLDVPTASNDLLAVGIMIYLIVPN